MNRVVQPQKGNRSTMTNPASISIRNGRRRLLKRYQSFRPETTRTRELYWKRYATRNITEPRKIWTPSCHILEAMRGNPLTRGGPDQVVFFLLRTEGLVSIGGANTSRVRLEMRVLTGGTGDSDRPVGGAIGEGSKASGKGTRFAEVRGRGSSPKRLSNRGDTELGLETMGPTKKLGGRTTSARPKAAPISRICISRKCSKLES